MSIRRIMAMVLVLVLGLPSLASAYENPIMTDINDPDVAQMDGVYHLTYPKGHGDGGQYLYSTSRDLLHWSDPVPILKQDKGTALWQGSFFRDTDGQLYLYYTTVKKGPQKAVHVAKAADFTGPFTDLGVVAPDSIDPFPMRDANGTLWLYYKNDLKGQKGIWVQKMSDPATPVAGSAKEILHPEANTFEDSGYQSVEGPTVIQRAGLYFLIYTGGPFGAKSYAVGYAVSKSPDGPFTRGKNNPILANSRSPSVYSPGVPTVVVDGAGKSWLVYRQRETAKNRSPRELTLDRLDDSKAAEGILSATATNGVVEPDPVPLP